MTDVEHPKNLNRLCTQSNDLFNPAFTRFTREVLCHLLCVMSRCIGTRNHDQYDHKFSQTSWYDRHNVASIITNSAFLC